MYKTLQLQILIANIQANLTLISKTLGSTTANDLDDLKTNIDLTLENIDENSPWECF